MKHYWAISENEVLVVCGSDEEGYDVCGAWECGIPKDAIKIIEEIKLPDSLKNLKFYYGPDK